MGVRPLAGELRSHMLRAKKKKNSMQECDDQCTCLNISEKKKNVSKQEIKKKKKKTFQILYQEIVDEDGHRPIRVSKQKVE